MAATFVVRNPPPRRVTAFHSGHPSLRLFVARRHSVPGRSKNSATREEHLERHFRSRRAGHDFILWRPEIANIGASHIVKANNMRVASIMDLAGTKASVVQVRAQAKDYLDIDALMRLGNISLPSALAAAQELYGPSFNPEITLKALSYFDDGNLRDWMAARGLLITTTGSSYEVHTSYTAYLGSGAPNRLV